MVKVQVEVPTKIASILECLILDSNETISTWIEKKLRNWLRTELDCVVGDAETFARKLGS